MKPDTPWARTVRAMIAAPCLFILGMPGLNANAFDAVTDLIDWSRPGLETGAAAIERGDRDEAVEELLRYYRARDQAYHFDPDQPLRNLEGIADETHDTSTIEDVMDRRFTFEQETVRFEDGIDWTRRIYDPEWAYMFHRHTHFLTLVEAYRRSGDERYMEEFAWQLREWNRQVDATHPRTLEVGLRMRHWVRLFPVAVHSEHFDTDLLALFLRDLHAMAESLNTRESGYRRGNWGTMEASGVLHAGTYFPEFRKAGEWRAVTADTLPGHFRDATTGDGVYRGRSPHYHNVVLRQAFDFLQLLEIGGEEPPGGFLDHYHKMLDFALAYTRPDLSIPQFGDSDNDPMRENLYAWGKGMERPDLLYLSTHGREGEKPSWRDRIFEEGEFAVFRSDWKEGTDARWLMVDFGRRGRGQFRIGSVDLAAYGRPLVVMPGRYRYHTEDDSRALFVSTPFQNTVSIDEKNQHPDPPRGLARHRIEGELQVVHFWHEGYSHLATGDNGEPAFSVVHERQVMAVRDAFWIVADRVRTGEPRPFSYAQNWRFQPTDLSPLEGFDRAFVTSYPEANIAVIPLAGEGEAIEKAGWYSPQYGVRHPAPWLSYEDESADGFVFFTLLAPFPGDEPLLETVRAERTGDGMEARLEWKNGYTDEIAVSFGDEKTGGRNRWTGWRNGERTGEESFE